MPLIDIQFQPGTQKSPQQTKITQAAFTDTDHVHFPDDRLTTIPAYSTASISSDYVTLLGAVRSVFAKKISGSQAGAYFYEGSSSRLYVINNGTRYNITPLADQKAETLGSAPLSVTNGSPTLTITWTAHGLSVGDYVEITGAVDVGGVDAETYINIGFTVATIPTSDTFTVTMGVNAGSTTTGGGSAVNVLGIGATATLGANPIATVDTDETVTISYTAHSLVAGDRIKITGATATGGLATTVLNKEHIVATVVDANSFTLEVGTPATSTVSGGGSAVRIFKQIAAGNIDQDAATGYGVGLYGEGIYGSGGPAQSAQVFPRIWSFANFGNDVVMCPGDYSVGDGQKIYIWDGDLTKAPTVLTNAPTDVNWVEVVNNSIVALRGTTVQIAEIGSGTVWTGITTYSAPVQRAWKLIACWAFNEKDAVIFTPNEAILLRYVGGADIWDLSDLFPDDGLIGPNAACVLNSQLFWRGYRGSYVYSGAPPQRIENAQNDDWITTNTNFGQTWKCITAVDPQNLSWYYYFPTGADNEPGDYVIHNLKNGSHTLGRMTRTAAQRGGIIDSTYLMENASSASVPGTTFRHFTNGAVTFSWSATTSFAYALAGEFRAMFDQFFPDSNQSGNLTLNLLTKEYPQGATTTTSNYTITNSTLYKTVKAAGKLIAFAFSGTTEFTLGGWKVNLRRLGRRS